MINIGDTVKIANNDNNSCSEDLVKFMDSLVNTIGIVTDIDDSDKDKYVYCVNDEWWWYEENLEKGHMKWVKDED